MSNDQREYHGLNLPLEPGRTLIGLVSLSTDESGHLFAILHGVDGLPLPRKRTPYALRRLADEFEIDAFVEELDGVAHP